MIAIIDGGSTKCDWVVLSLEGEEFYRTETLGFNPNITSKKDIESILYNAKIPADIDKIFFYGSGCGTEENKVLVSEVFQEVFPRANILVREDMLGAAYAAYTGNPSLVAILGTGSNVCFFDGEKIRTDIPSLGFIMGDEGSGSAMGKSLLKHFFMKKLPSDLHQAFEVEYGISIEYLINNIYHKPRANAFLASFNGFLLKNKNHTTIKNIIKEEFKNFLYYQVSAYPESQNVDINCVGSIAYMYSDLLHEVANSMKMKIGKIIQKPVDDLVKYHIKQNII